MLVLAGCSPSPSEQRHQESMIVSSAAATALMTIDAWRGGAIPGWYARDSLAAMGRQIAEALTKVQEADWRAGALQIAAGLESVRMSLGQGDRAAVDREGRI